MSCNYTTIFHHVITKTFLNVNKHDKMVIKEVCPPFCYNTNSDDHERRGQLFKFFPLPKDEFDTIFKMKTRYSGLDLSCQMQELKALIGMRVNKIYDIDKKTYLFRMQRTEEKAVIMLESGSRIHTTNSVWPKSDAPSGFTMKLRKHLRNKRLEDIYQFKTDRIAVLQFGINEVANYVIVELYDRGKVKKEIFLFKS